MIPIDIFEYGSIIITYRTIDILFFEKYADLDRNKQGNQLL